MKRSMVILVILLALLSLVACGEDQPSSQMSTPPAEAPTTKLTAPTIVLDETLLEGKTLSDYLVAEDGEYYLILPSSGKKLRILYAEYAPEDLERIDPALLMAAEAKLNYEMGAYDVDYHLYPVAYDGEIWLCAEAIMYLDQPDGEDGGCGTDHEHIMLQEKITQ